MKELLEVAYLYDTLKEGGTLKNQTKPETDLQEPTNKLTLVHRKGFSFYSSNTGLLVSLDRITGNKDQSAWWQAAQQSPVFHLAQIGVHIFHFNVLQLISRFYSAYSNKALYNLFQCLTVNIQLIFVIFKEGADMVSFCLQKFYHEIQQCQPYAYYNVNSF